jgi:hypothetical protein
MRVRRVVARHIHARACDAPSDRIDDGGGDERGARGVCVVCVVVGEVCAARGERCGAAASAFAGSV